ncbi:MAG: glycosyltransferase [Elusimicrobiota bacterium]|jgi:undecaprenyl-phosphate 4-deoxy-4-formamido-L-arabinose transferase
MSLSKTTSPTPAASSLSQTDGGPYLSIVIPVFNEQENLRALHQTLMPVLDGFQKPCEIIYVDDGSVDESLLLLREFQAQDPRVVVIEFSRNFGQHAAVFAGFDQARGQIIVTLDADLQNPPEAIPSLVHTIEAGYDVVGGWREDRQDPLFRRLASKVVNRIVSWSTGIRLRDYGCMLRAYRREVVEQIRKCSEISSFIPALANTFARSIAEIEVPHRDRAKGRTKYSMRRLIRLNFDLMTGFSLLPIQAISTFGLVVAVLGGALSVFLFIRRLIIGPEAEGLFTLFAILFAFIGVQILALGIIGEYVGRVYNEVRKRPRFVIKTIYNTDRHPPR